MCGIVRDQSGTRLTLSPSTTFYRYNFDGFYREMGGATTVDAGTTPMDVNSLTTANSSRIFADITMLCIASLTADSTATPATVFTTSANFPPPTSRHGSTKRNDGV